jgi:predicted aminopeptidase
MNLHWHGKFFIIFLICLMLIGCADLAYYRQAVSGQWQLLTLRRPLAEVLADPAIPTALQQRLKIAHALRDFASTELALPDNGSYRSYVDLQRPYLIENVFAAPELSLALRQWCFPVVGCVSYRGYFDTAAARQLAQVLRTEGADVYLAEIPAYSTLGWFDDPLLNTFVYWPTGQLAELMFHELAHQRLYIPGDSAFNESFASAVGSLGTRLWLAHHGIPAEQEAYTTFTRRRQEFLSLVTATRDELARLYASTQRDEVKRAGKQRLLTDLQDRYQTLKRAWGGYTGYDRWFNGDLNNAKLAALNTYTCYVPAFEVLFERHGGDFAAFYKAAEALGKLPPAQRKMRLQALLAERQTDDGRRLASSGEQAQPQQIQQADHRKLANPLAVAGEPHLLNLGLSRDRQTQEYGSQPLTTWFDGTDLTASSQADVSP